MLRILNYSYRVRNGIRAGTINISEDYFLRCFYPYGMGDPNNIEKGFLRSGLLVKVYSIVCALVVCLLYLLLCRHILVFLYLPHRRSLSPMKMKMVQRENNSARQTLRRKRPSVTLQTSLAWMVKLRRAQLHTLPFWYVI